MKKRAQTICIINNKGGVGKSTTVITLAGLLGSYGKEVLVIDTDPQGNSSQSFGLYRKAPKTISNIFQLKATELNKSTVLECISPTQYKGIHIIPSDDDFSFIEEDISKDMTRIRQYILKKALSFIEDNYDYILIDTAPGYNIISINTLCASDFFLTPVESDGYGYEGFKQLIKRINSIKGELHPKLEFLGVFLTRANVQTTLFKELYQEYVSNVGEKFIPIYIRHDNQAKESSTTYIPLLEYSKDSNIVKDYKKLLAYLNVMDQKNQKILTKEVTNIYKKEIQETNTQHVLKMLQENLKKLEKRTI